jgi:hypothetical protein
MKTRLTLLFLLISSALFAAPKLSDRASISVITCSPGNELYSVFGHSAIRVSDPEGADFVYNYGTFSFSDDFYLLFAQGKLNYRLSRTDFNGFIYEYEMTQRGVYEQVLDLSPERVQAVFDFLEINYLPENQYYLYDFFYDNCATRVRDVLNQTLGDDLTYHSNFASDSASFRNMIDLHLAALPWADFGIDLVLGAPCDKKLQDQDNMFLPDYVFAELERAKINGRPLVRSSRTVHDAGFILTPAPYSVPNLLTLLIAVLAFFNLFRVYQGKKPWIAFERFFLFLFGLLGVILLIMWFATDHSTTKNNMNLLWAVPFHFVAAFFVRSKRAAVKAYFKAFALLGVASTLTALFWPQLIHPAAYMMCMATTFILLRIAFVPSGKRA